MGWRCSIERISFPILIAVTSLKTPASRFIGLWNEAIAYAADRQQMSWLSGIVFNVTPQANDEIVDGAGVCVLVQIPHLLEN